VQLNPPLPASNSPLTLGKSKTVRTNISQATALHPSNHVTPFEPTSVSGRPPISHSTHSMVTMSIPRSSMSARTLLTTPLLSSSLRSSARPQNPVIPILHSLRQTRPFHPSYRRDVLKPFLLADIGEGITECQLIQWFVQPGTRVEQFDKLCEVQSDKASVEITSPFDGVVKKLYYEPDEMAVTGRPLVDIDIEDEAQVEEGMVAETVKEEDGGGGKEDVKGQEGVEKMEEVGRDKGEKREEGREDGRKEGMRTLATPAVRHLTKELDADIADVQGTGKDGRVLKEDVHRFARERDGQQQPQSQPSSDPSAAAPRSSQTSPPPQQTGEDRKVPLTPIQTRMFQTMTRSLQIPHFLYTTTADLTNLTSLRKRLNSTSQSEEKLTPLPFILKAISLAFTHNPLLNAALDTTDPSKPSLTYKAAHNFGIAIDSPSGLLVPVLKNIQSLSILEISSQLRTLSQKARSNSLSPSDFSGATFTVSNIGSIGGGVVSPVISAPQVGIVGVGRSKTVPAFGERGEVIRREELTLSWSADHRVVDGAECARCAERVVGYLEEVGGIVVGLR
jgi:2-oxoisovalerate dehydrogenase E2 component (dihydrolipoyl transacylase)